MLPKLKNTPWWLTCSTVVGSCFIYKIWWFAPACLPGPVIHEWTRQREPAIVEVQWEHWILRINFFHVTLLFPARSNPSLSSAVSAMTFPFLSLIVWSTIICPPADKWLEYYAGATLWSACNAVGGGEELCRHHSDSSLFFECGGFDYLQSEILDETKVGVVLQCHN